MEPEQAWSHIRAERERLVVLLQQLTPEQWRARSLCADWTVEEVVAHLTAAANTGTAAWILNMFRARFNTDRHNARLLAKHRGVNVADTLARFREAVPNRIAPTKDYAAFLGEVIVHGQDIAQPLGAELVPSPAALLEVAWFYASRDFAVNSRTLTRGLALAASDADFSAGEGETVRGPLLALVMAMAGRPTALAQLEGDGVELLRARIGGAAGA